MVNSTQLDSNVTVSINKTLQRVTLFILMLPLFCIFLYFMAVILNVFFTVPHVRENPRYKLFIHMLVNDLAFLTISFYLFTTYIYFFYLPLSICYIIVSFATCAFRITLYNLALMSLERYVAICHPLRHAQLCTAQRSSAAIAIMWTVGLIPQLADFIVFCFFAEKRVFSLNVICYWSVLIANEIQEVIRTQTIIISLIIVGLIIAYTYIKVMLVARRIGSGRSASKAGKTVLLHAFQLMLCMLSLTSTYTDRYLTSYFVYMTIFNFFLFMCLPRVISPLIYGIRDEALGKHIRIVFSSGRFVK
ncbi:odorant receptor 131-2-like [Mixophyes fleayi]|uniref:odorant receptor 131-2-like n=1 Tax=Mixophyes fleayi TaxID=3061075 RepID=UPI003F4DC3EB